MSTEENIIQDLKFGYVEAMLFCGVDDTTLSDDETDTNFYDGDMDILTEDLNKKILEICTAFYQKNKELITEVMAYLENDPYDYMRMGNDLFFTAHGHGVGFWDRSELGEFGNSLTTVTEDGKTCSPYALNEVFYNGEVIDGQ